MLYLEELPSFGSGVDTWWRKVASILIGFLVGGWLGFNLVAEYKLYYHWWPFNYADWAFLFGLPFGALTGATLSYFTRNKRGWRIVFKGAFFILLFNVFRALMSGFVDRWYPQ